MESNRSRRDMGRYSQQGRSGCQQQNMPAPAPTPYMRKEGCGCGGSFERIDQYPLAMAYVPWQKFGSTYELEKGFHTGTIFPELNLPFMRARCSKS